MSAKRPDPQPELERALALARAARPSELPETDVRRLVRRSAIEAIDRRARARAQRRLLVLAGALGCAAALGFVWQRSLLHTEPAARVEEAQPLLELALPAGDKLAASPGAQFELVQSAETSRRIALRDGAAVFSIAPLASGETFSVQTPHLYIEVRGTVFSVEVGDGRTRVHVHEGAVQVQGRGAPRSLRAGERFGSDGLPVPELVSRALARRAAELAEERAREHASTPDAQPPSPEGRDAAIGPGSEPPRPEDARARRATEVAAAATHGELMMREADALRALGDAREAADLYLRAHAALPSATGANAAFKAADLYLRVLGDASRALHVLDRAALDAPGAPLRERALLLRIEASQRLDLPVRALAEQYLADYPDSAGAARMRLLTQ